MQSTESRISYFYTCEIGAHFYNIPGQPPSQAATNPYPVQPPPTPAAVDGFLSPSYINLAEATIPTPHHSRATEQERKADAPGS
jgi:hypothetical protein